MTWIPQLYQHGSPYNTITEVPILPYTEFYGDYASYFVTNGGSGYISGDIGHVVTLTMPGAIVPATGVISGVSAGKITSYAPFTLSGLYTWANDFPVTSGITGGSGSGAIVGFNTGIVPTIYTDNSGFGTTITSLTMSLWGWVDGDVLNMNMFQYGVYINFVSEGSVALILSEQKPDGFDKVPILDAKFVGYNAWERDRPVNLLVSFDISSQQVCLFVNDVEWPMDAGGWISTIPITCNISNVTFDPRTLTAFGLSNLWLNPGYTDFRIAGNRRTFIGSGGTQIDPTTLPTSAINLYYEKGDAPVDIINNHGTAGAWTAVGDTQYFMKGAHNPLIQIPFDNPVDNIIAINHSVTIPIGQDPSNTDGEQCYTERPGGSMVFSMDTLPVNGSASVTTNGIITYTPNTDFVGGDTFSVLATEVMPAGYTPPGWSRPINYFISVHDEDVPAGTGLKMVTLYPTQLPDDVYSVFNRSSDDLTSPFTSPGMSQFAISVWCCNEVHIRAPNGWDTPYTIDMRFTPTECTLQFYNFAHSKLFSGTFTNPGAVVNPYHVMFSINTEAETYNLWVGNVAWVSTDAAFVTTGQIWNAIP